MNVQQVKIVFAILLLITVSFVIYFARKGKPSVNKSNEEAQLLDSIAFLQRKIENNKHQILILENRIDSLSQVETEIIYRYREKTRYIYLNASPFELDSIIRSAWKPDSGYHPMLRTE